MPNYVPERWKQKDGMPGGFKEWGFLTVKDKDKEQDKKDKGEKDGEMKGGELRFWRFRKSDGAFSPLPPLKTVRGVGGMDNAYRALIKAAVEKQEARRLVRAARQVLVGRRLHPGQGSRTPGSETSGKGRRAKENDMAVGKTFVSDTDPTRTGLALTYVVPYGGVRPALSVLLHRAAARSAGNAAATGRLCNVSS